MESPVAPIFNEDGEANEDAFVKGNRVGKRSLRVEPNQKAPASGLNIPLN